MVALKRGLLQQAGIDTAGIAFVRADFETEDWFSRHMDAGDQRQLNWPPGQSS